MSEEELVKQQIHQIWENAVHDENFTYDLCMVFQGKPPTEPIKRFMRSDIPVDQQVPVMTGPDIVDKLKAAGLRVKMYQSVGHDEVYCLIGASEKRLEMEADRIDFDVLLDREKTLTFAADELHIKLAERTKERDEKCTLITTDIWDNIFGKFDPSPKKTRFYKTYDEDGPYHKDSFFLAKDRINLTISIIEAPTSLKGAGLSLNRLQAMKYAHLKAFFPLHDPEKLEDLKKKWSSLSGVWSPPLTDIRNYFGEKVALYFSFLNFYTKSLVFPSILGLIWILLQRANSYSAVEQVLNTKVLWLFAIFMIFWAALLLEYWKRKQSVLRVEWGMTNFKSKEQTRPEFRGEWVVNPIDGKLFSYFPSWKKVLRVMVSQSVVFTLITCVIASVAGVFYARIQISNSDKFSSGGASVVGALINVAVIQFFNFVYGSVGRYLNEFENHRTDTDYENALIAKSFLFKFVNSYNSLFYIAFFKNIGAGDTCNPDGLNKSFPCLEQLAIQLVIVFGSMIVINNTLEIFVPWLKGIFASKKEQGDSTEHKTWPEKQFELNKYESVFDDFDELTIQFGFVYLFVVAMPLTPLMAFVNNILEAYVDSSKLLKLNRRPEPRGAYDIGTWHSILNVVSWVGIVTNIGICVLYTNELREWAGFTAQTISTSSTYNPSAVLTLALVFFGAEHVLAILKFAVQYFLPDEPSWVNAHIARQEYLVDILIRDAVEEEDDSELLMADEDEEHDKRKTLTHVAEQFGMLDEGQGAYSPWDVSNKLEIDEHLTFSRWKSKSARNVLEDEIKMK
jgi:hypothetical protein